VPTLVIELVLVGLSCRLVAKEYLSDDLLTLHIALGYSIVAIDLRKTQEKEDNKKQKNHGSI
jgi:hypothetical protein